MSDTLRNILDRREAELSELLADLRTQMAPLEQELRDVRVARQAIAAQPKLQPNGFEATERAMAYFNGQPFRPTEYQNWTMKQLVRKALKERFSEGATARQLLDLFHDEWGRIDIVRSSLSPQLSRLSKEGVIYRKALIWHLDDDGQRQIFGETHTENGEADEAEPEDRDEEGLQPSSHPHFDQPIPSRGEGEVQA